MTSPSPAQARPGQEGRRYATHILLQPLLCFVSPQSYLPCICRAVSSYSYDGHLCSLAFIIYLCEALFCVGNQPQLLIAAAFYQDNGNALSSWNSMLRLDTVPGCCKTVTVTRKLRPLQLQTAGGARADAVWLPRTVSESHSVAAVMDPGVILLPARFSVEFIKYQFCLNLLAHGYLD